MADTTPLAKAELRELRDNFADEVQPAHRVQVQFNPETLKVTYANQVVQGTGAGDQRGPQVTQFVGAGSTKLSLTLWFDVTAPQPEGKNEDDVRKLTREIAYFITPQEVPNSRPKRYLPAAVRFVWGTFQFDGVVESLDESLEYFSGDGVPLRASMSLSLSQQRIQEFAFAGGSRSAGGGSGGGGGGRPGLPSPGTSAFAQAAAGATMPGLTASISGGVSWQALASANGIENPRQLAPGQLIDFSVGVSGRLG